MTLIVPTFVIAHGGGLDKQGGHLSRSDNTYHCHRESCVSLAKNSDKTYPSTKLSAYKKPSAPARSSTQAKSYNRKDWPHWVDEDGDCQNTRQELLIAFSTAPVSFKDHRKCTVRQGQWYGIYTVKTFTNAADLDIDHIVPLAHAHRHGAATWTRAQRRAFANDPVNLLVVDDSTNQSKSDKAPHEWLPPKQEYWCEYVDKWMLVKAKYDLSFSGEEREVLAGLKRDCAANEKWSLYQPAAAGSIRLIAERPE